MFVFQLLRQASFDYLMGFDSIVCDEEEGDGKERFVCMK